MAQDYTGMAIGVFELESECICFVALDAAAKAADVKIQGVERNRLKSGACVKMRGSVSDVKAAMEAALDAAKGRSKVVSTYDHRRAVRGCGDSDRDDDLEIAGNDQTDAGKDR